MSDDERRERYAAAIRNIRRKRDGKNLERQAEAVMRLADEEQAELEREVGRLDVELRAELMQLWHDLATAQRMAYRGNWSVQCDNLAHRIKSITGLVGPCHWHHVNPAIFDAGNDVYARLHAEIDVDIDPADIAAAREYRAAQVREAKEAIGGDQ